MLGPDSKAAGASGMPACLVQPSPWATKSCATPMTGMTPTRSGCCADAPVADTSRPAANRDERMRMGFLFGRSIVAPHNLGTLICPSSNDLPYHSAWEPKSSRLRPSRSNTLLWRLLTDLGRLDRGPRLHPRQRRHVAERLADRRAAKTARDAVFRPTAAIGDLCGPAVAGDR